MKKRFLLLFLPLLLSANGEEEAWVGLLDKNLSQWDSYLSYRLTDSYDGSVPKDDTGVAIKPFGLNADKFGVFSVAMENDEPVLKISGEIYGCLITKKEYDNYHLRLMVNWGEAVFPPRLSKGKDSGILYHSFGEHGADFWRSWMFGHEFQVMRGRTGDYWTIGPTAMAARAIPEEWIMNFVANENYPFLEVVDADKKYGYCLRSSDEESNEGEWTLLELICFEDKSLHIVNGEVVMVLRNSRNRQAGKDVLLDRGKIQLQSEAAEVYYKAIEMRRLQTIPSQYQHYYQ